MEVKVYGAAPLQLRDALVLIVSWSLPSGSPAAEAHIIRGGVHADARGQYLFRDDPEEDVPEEILETIDVTACAYEWARGKLEEDLLEWYKGQPVGTDYPSPCILVELGVRELVRRRLRRIGELKLAVCARESRSNEFREWIEMIARLPQLNVQTY
ncbi:MAG: hypothetical protein ACYC2K_17775 [Gemmatimonadales bacterium]